MAVKSNEAVNVTRGAMEQIGETLMITIPKFEEIHERYLAKIAYFEGDEFSLGSEEENTNIINTMKAAGQSMLTMIEKFRVIDKGIHTMVEAMHGNIQKSDRSMTEQLALLANTTNKLKELKK